jgi:protein-L-isoaspartate(D-aspartate) O-methyltransferase
MTTTLSPDIELSRFNMIEQQIRTWDVNEPNVLNALASLQRQQFVPHEFKSLAFCDMEIPLQIHGIETHQAMLAPKLEARLTQSLQLNPDDCVLEIGTGSGYQAALLACLARQVTSVEIDSRLANFAQDNLKLARIANVTVETGDGSEGWGNTEFDAILVTGSVPVVPDALKYQLREGGRLVVIAGQAPAMTVFRITRTTAASFEVDSLFETVVKPLVGPRVSRFKF